MLRFYLIWQFVKVKIQIVWKIGFMVFERNCKQLGLHFNLIQAKRLTECLSGWIKSE